MAARIGLSPPDTVATERLVGRAFYFAMVPGEKPPSPIQLEARLFAWSV